MEGPGPEAIRLDGPGSEPWARFPGPVLLVSSSRPRIIADDHPVGVYRNSKCSRMPPPLRWLASVGTRQSKGGSWLYQV